MGRIGTFFKVLGAVGLLITIIAGVIELVEGAEQYVIPLSSSSLPIVPQAMITDSLASSSPAGRRS